jgi:hypothetical protein
MRPFFAICLAVFALAPQKQCSLDGPIADKVAAPLQQFFPNAHVEMAMNSQLIVGLTCVHGTSPDFARQIAVYLSQDQKTMGYLALLQLGQRYGATPYRFLAIGFETSLVRYNIQTRAIDIVPAPTGYAEHYQQVCGYVASVQQ